MVIVAYILNFDQIFMSKYFNASTDFFSFRYEKRVFARMSKQPCVPWCIVKCFTAEEKKDFELILDSKLTLDELNDYVQRKCGENYRCYILRGTGTLKKLRRDSEFQALVDQCNNEVELYVKKSRTLSISKQHHPPKSLYASGIHNQKPFDSYNSTVYGELFTRPKDHVAKPTFQRGHRRTKSAHATYNQQRPNLYIPEPPEPLTPTSTSTRGNFSFYTNTGGGVFVPADGSATPDSGFQSPEQIFRSHSHMSSNSPENSSATSSNHYEGDMPRHLAEEHPLDSLKDLSVDDSIASSTSDAVEVEHFSKIGRNSSLNLNLPENYLVRNMIGSGGFAKVYHCIDQDTGRDLAIKQVYFDDQCTDSNRELKALKNEISILKKLDHPNIVLYYGSNISDGHFNIFMEYVSGGSMRSFIQNNGPLSNRYTIKCLHHILLGLSYLHQEAIIHRDLKAANVLKTSDGTIKIADFGASKRFDTLRSINGANSVVGTPYWMSPEVIRAQSE